MKVKSEQYKKEGFFDAAARLALDAEQQVSLGNYSEAGNCYKEANYILLEAKNKYRQQPRNEIDQTSIEVMQSLADDYRRKSNLINVREKTGIDKIISKIERIKKQ